MKIGFIGNANNYPLMLARELVRNGEEILFILASRHPLDRPEGRYGEFREGYPSWMVDLSPIELWNYDAPDPRFREVVRLLSGCDVVVYNQYYLCLHAYVGRPCVAMLTGTDLLPLTTERMLNERLRSRFGSEQSGIEYWRSRFFYRSRMEEQRYCIRDSLFFTGFPAGAMQEYDGALKETGVSESRRFPLLLIDAERRDGARKDNRENSVLTVFYVARLTWNVEREPRESVLDYKGTDVFLRGFAMFAKAGRAVKLILVRKGAHIADTEDLIRDLGIEACIEWRPELTQIEFESLLNEVDVAVDQMGSSMLGMGALQAMAAGRPLIAADTLRAFGFTESPVLHADTSDLVCSRLCEMLDAQEREIVGQKSSAFVWEHFSAAAAAPRFLARLKAEFHSHHPNENAYLSIHSRRERRRARLGDYATKTLRLRFLESVLRESGLTADWRIEIDVRLSRQEGFAHVVSLPDYWRASDSNLHSYGLRSPLVVLEDGKILSTPHAPHADIRQLGLGRYSHWGTDLYFSTTDNSDPRTNGRSYTVVTTPT